MLEAAVGAGTYSEKVTAALSKKSKMVRKRLDALGSAPGQSTRTPKGAVAKKGKAKQAQGTAVAKKATQAKGKATTGATVRAAKSVAPKKVSAKPATANAAKVKPASPKATASSPKAAKAASAKSKTSQTALGAKVADGANVSSSKGKAITPRASTAVKAGDPAKLCVPILKAAAAEDDKFKNGDDSVLQETVRLYEEGLQLLEQAVSTGTYTAKVKAALRKKAAATRSRLDFLQVYEPREAAPEPEPEPEPAPSQRDPAKLCVPILKMAAAKDAKFKNGDDSVLPAAIRMYTEGLNLLDEAVQSGSHNSKVKQALAKKAAATRMRRVAVQYPPRA